LDLSSYKSQAQTPLSHTEQHKIRMPLLLARFSKARRLDNKNNVDYLKWVKDDLPNSENATASLRSMQAGFIQCNVSCLDESGAQMELNWGDD